MLSLTNGLTYFLVPANDDVAKYLIRRSHQALKYAAAFMLFGPCLRLSAQ